MRKFQSSDTALLVNLFYETVHTVNAKDYSIKQLDAWAPEDEKELKIAYWEEALSQNQSQLAKRRGILLVNFKMVKKLRSLF
ncbi:hypothetical protein [Paenibacillus pinihumi]|uniref:hypothetical protein n=1 Tax=Paenibacillus pinihumi TaxID=669462 RepID=UPI00040A2BD3|nr:hypothetical protein [Paenibacillus pinihumi]